MRELVMWLLKLDNKSETIRRQNDGPEKKKGKAKKNDTKRKKKGKKADQAAMLNDEDIRELPFSDILKKSSKVVDPNESDNYSEGGSDSESSDEDYDVNIIIWVVIYMNLII